jgi:hypothetical protein
MSNNNFHIKINGNDLKNVQDMLGDIKGAPEKVTVRAVNKTLTGVVTDGTAILKEHYALTATAIRESFKVNKCAFKDPGGSVSSKGTFIRLINFGARQTKTGVSVKVLSANPRKVLTHAFIGNVRKDQTNKQVYWRKYQGPHKPPVPGRAYAKMGFEYRFPVRALYGPRIQDYLGDENVFKTLTNMAQERLTKNIQHELDYLVSQINQR